MIESKAQKHSLSLTFMQNLRQFFDELHTYEQQLHIKLRHLSVLLQIYWISLMLIALGINAILRDFFPEQIK